MAVATTQAQAAGSRLKITPTADGISLFVPEGNVEVTIREPGIEIVTGAPSAGGTANPRYFVLRSPASQAMISGWIEPARAFKGFKALWKADRSRLARTWTIENETFGREGDWEYVRYTILLKKGVVQSHIRACCVKAEAWVDVHISKTSASTTFDDIGPLLSRIEINRKEQRQ